MFGKSITLIGVLVVVLFAGSAFADGKVSTKSGKAIDGHDPVAYFTEGKPVEGSNDYSYAWNGATWLFASADNLAQFKSMPERYAPQFGGYCAWAVSQGYTAPSDPDAWKIVDDRLYLNYSKSIQERWGKDIPKNIAAGNDNWPNIENKLGS